MMMTQQRNPAACGGGGGDDSLAIMAAMATTHTEPNNKKRKIGPAPSTAMGVFLPEELVWEVLLRLPSKSLARFRCVCRSWNHLLSSDDAFQRLYHDNDNGAGRRLMFTAAELAPPHLCELCEGSFSLICVDCPRFVGGKPCHRGVVLLSRPCMGAYTLCNLSKGGFLRLPPCPTRTVGYLCATGLGYHAATNEYKVVQLALMTDRPIWESLDCQVLTVSVGDTGAGASASSSSDWSWRSSAGGGCGGGGTSASAGFLNGLLIEDMDPVFANGCLHWTLVTDLLLRDKPEGILSFSVATESFATVPLPPFVTEDLVPYDENHPFRGRLRSAPTPDYRWVMQPIGTALAELDGCLCMIRDLRRRRRVVAYCSRVFEVWKLKDYESGVWSLDYRIDLDLTTNPIMETAKLVLPICYLRRRRPNSSDENKKRKFVLATTAHDVHVYDPQTATIETIASLPHANEYPSSQDNRLFLVMHQESLLHIDGMKYIYGSGE